jgi:hypothetical protein
MKKIVFSLHKNKEEKENVMNEKQAKDKIVESIDNSFNVEKVVSMTFWIGASRRHENPSDPTHASDYTIKHYSQLIENNFKALGSPTQSVPVQNVGMPITDVEKAIVQAAVTYKNAVFGLEGTGKKDMAGKIAEVEQAKSSLWKAIQKFEGK